MAFASVGVVGGGIAGVTAARELARRGLQVSLYEQASVLGGRLGSVDVSGFSVGWGCGFC